jgi:hypothetical protein
MLTSRSQTALATSTDAAGSGVRRDSTNTHTIVSGAQTKVVNTLAAVSDSHRNALKSSEDMRGQTRMVGTIRTLSVTEQPLKISQTHAMSAIPSRSETDV